MASSSKKVNLRTICDALGSIKTKWFEVGIQLGIPYNKLEEFEESRDPFAAVVNYWLRGNVTESVNPISWDTIVTALRSKYVGEPGLAREISTMYCQQEESTTADSYPSTVLANKHQLQENKQEEQAATANFPATLSQSLIPISERKLVEEMSKMHCRQEASILADGQPAAATEKQESKEEKQAIPSQSPPPISESKLDPDVKLDLNFILQKNLKEIIAKYASYRDCLRMAIIKQGVSADDLRSYLLSISATRETCKCPKIALLADKEAQLKKCNTVTDIFNLLNTICVSFLKYDIFQFILTRYGISDDQDTLKYPEHLKAYIKKHKISEFAKINPLLKTKNGSKELIVKYDVEPNCSLDTIEELKILIADIVEINPSALEIVDIKEGCVIVKFFILASLADALFTPDTVFTPQQVEKLRAASVLWLKCNGHTFYFERQKHEDEAAPASEVVGLQADFRANQIVTENLTKRVSAQLSKEKAGFKKDSICAFSDEELPSHCPNHDGEVMKIFCETCSEAICWMCQFKGGKHHGHNCEALNEAYKQCEESTLSLLQGIQKTLAKLDECSMTLCDQRASIEEEIHSTIKADDRKTELISQLHQLTQTKLKSLAAQKDQIETTQAQLSGYLHCMEDVRSQPIKITTIKQMKELTTTLQLDTFDCTEADMQLLVLPDCKGGVYTDGLLDFSKCFVLDENIEVLATVGAKSFASLRVINFSNWQHKEVVTSISCKLVSALKDTIARGNIEKRGRNQYKISYQPTIKGVHQLHVKVEGQHIKGSPLLVTAKSSVENLSTPILTIKGVKAPPTSIAVNKRGEMVVAEYTRLCLTIVSPTGEILKSYSGLGQGPFEFYPSSVAIDGEGNILVTDRENHCIQKLTFQGELLASVGEYGSGPLKFYSPSGIAFNASNDRVYVVDRNCHIQILNADLSYFGMFGKRGTGKGELDGPSHLACDSIGNVYVTDFYHHCVQVFTAEGEFLRVIGWRGKDRGEMKEPYGIAIDSSDKVYVSDWETHSISIFTAEGQFLYSFGSFGEEQGQFDMPAGLAVSTSGVLYVCDQYNFCIKVF